MAYASEVPDEEYAMLGLGARWKCGWQRNGNGWQGIEWGVPYEGTASGAELTLDELKEKVAQLAAANNTSWDDGRIMIWRVPASEADESIPMSANKHPEIFMDFHPTTTDRFFSNKWHHPYPYMP